MTRGNQREADRARAQARNAKMNKKGSGANGDRMKQALSDADRLREKQRQAEERKKALAAGLPDPYPKGKPSKADNKKKAALSKKKKGKK